MTSTLLMTFTQTVIFPLFMSSFCTVVATCLVQCCPDFVLFLCLFVFGKLPSLLIWFPSEELIILSKCS